MNKDELCSKVMKRVKNKDCHVSDITAKDIQESFMQAKGEGGVSLQLFEEMAELTERISKLLRGKIKKNDITLLEEIADVEVSLSTFKLLVDADEEIIQYVKDIKLERILDRLRKGEE